MRRAQGKPARPSGALVRAAWPGPGPGPGPDSSPRTGPVGWARARPALASGGGDPGGAKRRAGGWRAGRPGLAPGGGGGRRRRRALPVPHTWARGPARRWAAPRAAGEGRRLPGPRRPAPPLRPGRRLPALPPSFRAGRARPVDDGEFQPPHRRVLVPWRQEPGARGHWVRRAFRTRSWHSCVANTSRSSHQVILMPICGRI